MNSMPFQMPKQVSEPMYSREMRYESMPMPEPMPEPMPHPRSIPVIEPAHMTRPAPEPEPTPVEELKSTPQPSKIFYPLRRRYMMWLHSLVISVVEGLPDVQLNSRRVLSCNTEMLDCLKPSFSKEAANTLAELMNQDIVYTVQLTQAIKSRTHGNSEWERLRHNTDQLIGALKKGSHDIDCDKLSLDYAEYQDLLKTEMNYKVTRKY
jgi:hypothetical protein